MNFNQLKVGQKIIFGFLCTAILTLFVGGVAIYSLKKANLAAIDLYENQLVSNIELSTISINLQKVRVFTRDLLLDTDTKAKAEHKSAIEELLSKNSTLIETYEKLVETGIEKELFNKMIESRKEYRADLNQFMQLVDSSKTAEANALLYGKMKTSASNFFESVDKLIDYQDKEAKETNATNASNGRFAISLMIALILISILLSIILGKSIEKAITSPLSAATSIATSGDLSLRIGSTLKDEIGALSNAIDMLSDRLQKKANEATALSNGDFTAKIEVISEKDTLGMAFDTMAKKLTNLIKESQETVEQVMTGTTQMSSASQQLSTNATTQAASLEEISSSMTEIGSQTKHNAENATQANTFAKTARDAAEIGRKKIDTTVLAMNDITQASHQIAKIIKVIDDIAFQTNLLALNAAVEAARAGAHGKGFAVVADEVRALAGRSAKAAKETAELIETALKKVEAGSGVAKESADSFNEIASGIVKVADLVAEIAAASGEQAQGISQVSQGISQIDNVTQQNTSNAEETASIATELNKKVIGLQKNLNQFKVANQTKVAMSEIKSSPVVSQPVAPAPKPVIKREMVKEKVTSKIAPKVTAVAAAVTKKVLNKTTAPAAPFLKTVTPSANKGWGTKPKVVDNTTADPSLTQEPPKKPVLKMAAAPAAKTENAPEIVIALDDKEFGKY